MTSAYMQMQDTEIAGADDPRMLEYAAEHGFIILSHDVNTLRDYFYDRIEKELPAPGLFLVHKQTPISDVIDAVELIILASDESDWHGRATYIPLS